MRRIGIDLGVLEPGKPLPYRVPDCPGALLRVNRDEFDEYAKGGEQFVTPRRDIPFDARGDARVMCRNEVMRAPNPRGVMVEYGLCRSCSELEKRHRDVLRALARAK